MRSSTSLFFRISDDCDKKFNLQESLAKWHTVATCDHLDHLHDVFFFLLCTVYVEIMLHNIFKGNMGTSRLMP